MKNESITNQKRTGFCPANRVVGADANNGPNSIEAAKSAIYDDLDGLQADYKNLFDGYLTGRETLWAEAKYLNDLITPVGLFQENDKTLNQILLQAMLAQNGEFTNTQFSTLYSIAAQCPKEGGNAVMKAGFMLDGCQAAGINHFTNSCLGMPPSGNTSCSVMLQNPLPRIGSTSQTVPAIRFSEMDKTVFLENTEAESATLQLFDLMGRSLFNSQVSASDNYRLNLSNSVSSGVYMIQITLPDGFQFAQKLTILH